MVDNAGFKDIVLESEVTTIQDCEDSSVAAVEVKDKIGVYRNWPHDSEKPNEKAALDQLRMRVGTWTRA